MGRMLEALRQPEAEANYAETSPGPAGKTPQLQVVAEDPDEPMPYIEVGAKGKAVEGSPDVLAAPALRPLAARAPVLAPQGPLSVTFHPSHSAAALTPRMAPEIIAYHHPEDEVSEQYVGLLSQILPEPADEGCRVVLFTAVGPAAGVTTTLLNLAVSACSARGSKVVVVDANLRRPGVAARVGLSSGPGLRDLFTGSAALEQVVRGTTQERLHVLTAGPASTQTNELNPEAVRWLVAWLRQRFDLILFDAPACDSNAELAALMSAADRVLLVLDQADMNRPDVRAATRAIARMGGQVSGLLVTS